MDSQLLYQFNPWWEGEYQLENVLPRPGLQQHLEGLLHNRAVIFLTGLRRVGKTTLMKLLIRHLLKKPTVPAHIFYFSMDDYQTKDLNILEIITAYRQLQRLSVDTKVYLFLDEISYKEDFRLQLKNLHDREQVKIFASSSSASVLQDQRGLLTGRERCVEITPLTFNEYLTFKNIEVKQRDKALLSSYFEDYLQHGGMPEYILHNNDREYLIALVDDIIHKDIIAYHKIKNPNLIKDYFILLMERSGKQISLNKIANILDISTDTARRYLQMFVDCYLVYLVDRYGKTNENLLSPKKIYAADLGIRNLITGFRDKGAVFENLVFMTIKNKNPKYLYQDGIELDFLTQDQILIEVKYGKELNVKQLALFESYPAKQKIMIKNYEDFAKFIK